MKKISRLFPLLLLVGISVGCGAQNAPDAAASEKSEPLQMETLCVELPRACAEDADAVSAFAQELQNALSMHGLDVENVSVSFGTSEAATAQALADGGVQAAFLSGESYVRFGTGALAAAAGSAFAQRDNGDSINPADWNGEKNFTAPRDASQAGIRTLLVSGPSDYGAQLARRVLGGKAPSWAELDHAAWGVVAGETDMASQWLEDNYEGNTIEDLTSVAVFDTCADLLEALANGQVDAAVLTEDTFYDCVAWDLWTTPADEYVESAASRGLGRENPMWDEVTVLGVSERYFSMAAVVSQKDETASSDAFIAAFQTAMLDLSQSHGDTLASVGLPAMARVTDDQFDGMRRMLAGKE